ncbi:MAG: glucose-6-phosphate dehydrogenase (coenzyme-F420) [Micrococcales bacterium]|nr:glucose-6-phosphate dehydrogenase (coenzyme-F420) [Micrococcales bacterium]
MTLRIGYKASCEQFGPGELAGYAIRAEQLGFDSAFIADHFQPWRHTGGHAPASIPWLAEVAARTDRIVLGTSVLTPTFRYNPAVIAQSFATMACLHPGRFILGVGTGEALNEVAVGSVQGGWPEFKERFARLREAVEVIRGLWTTQRFDFEGEYYRTSGATIYDRPDEPVPVYIAAGGPLVARYAGRKGDGFICTSGKGRELYEDKLLPAVAQGLTRVGRSEGDIDRMIEIKLSYDRDPELALENTRFWAPLSLSAEQKHSLPDPAAVEAFADALPIQEVAKRWIVASTPQQALEQVRVYTDLGFDHLVFHGPGHDQERFLSAFAQDVLPGLRELS